MRAIDAEVPAGDGVGVFNGVYLRVTAPRPTYANPISATNPVA
jgi:hypothetical protein